MYNNKKALSSKQEKMVAKNLDGKVQSNSGATIWQKGDVILQKHGILIECKTKETESKTFSIKKEWLEKIKQEAFGMGLNSNRATLVFDFGDGTPFYVITEKFYKEILSLLQLEEDK